MLRQMPSAGLAALPLALLLQACSSTPPTSQVLTADSQCPLAAQPGQLLILNLPGNPTTGYRWNLVEATQGVLESLGPEVFHSPQDEVIGGEGTSTWRFQVTGAGAGRLYLTYARPWETSVEPTAQFDCRVEAR